MTPEGKKISAVIVAAGKGLRMGGSIPKQYMMLGDMPVLVHTLAAFEDSMVDEVVLVCPKGDEDYIEEHIIRKYGITMPVSVVAGGNERFDSSYAGIEKCEAPDYILVHDGVRCLVTAEDIDDVCLALKENKACCPGVAVKDSIRLIDDEGNSIGAPERRLIRAIQTPQGFEAELVKTAYKRFYEERSIDPTLDVSRITDDTMLVEKYMGAVPKIIVGNPGNIKITTPEDLTVGLSILKSREVKS